MRVGELFAGIGGASLAVGMVYPDAETVWQADIVNEAVRRRHFPDAAQLVGDAREVAPPQAALALQALLAPAQASLFGGAR